MCALHIIQLSCEISFLNSTGFTSSKLKCLSMLQIEHRKYAFQHAWKIYMIFFQSFFTFQKPKAASFVIFSNCKIKKERKKLSKIFSNNIRSVVVDNLCGIEVISIPPKTWKWASGLLNKSCQCHVFHFHNCRH